jgi:hypothetical protein
MVPDGVEVEVDLDDGGVRSQQRPVPGGPPVQAGAEGDDDVGLLDQLSRHGGGETSHDVEVPGQPGEQPPRHG